MFTNLAQRQGFLAVRLLNIDHRCKLSFLTSVYREFIFQLTLDYQTSKSSLVASK